jgi:hypothetical protein
MSTQVVNETYKAEGLFYLKLGWFEHVLVGLSPFSHKPLIDLPSISRLSLTHNIHDIVAKQLREAKEHSEQVVSLIHIRFKIT